MYNLGSGEKSRSASAGGRKSNGRQIYRLTKMPALLRNLSVLPIAAVMLIAVQQPALAINGGTLRMTPRNGWRAFEIITVGENPAGDGINYSLPGAFDGLGAWLPDAATLRVQMNHETSDAAVSEVNLSLASFQPAIANMINTGTTGGVPFVTLAQQAYDRWTNNGGASWTNTVDNTTTSFNRFCSGQSYKPNTFGFNRGFVDEIYMVTSRLQTSRPKSSSCCCSQVRPVLEFEKHSKGCRRTSGFDHQRPEELAHYSEFAGRFRQIRSGRCSFWIPRHRRSPRRQWRRFPDERGQHAPRAPDRRNFSGFEVRTSSDSRRRLS
jgi:hypothetical protein